MRMCFRSMPEIATTIFSVARNVVVAFYFEANLISLSSSFLVILSAPDTQFVMLSRNLFLVCHKLSTFDFAPALTICKKT